LIHVNEPELSVGVFYFVDGHVYARPRPLSALTSDSPATGNLVSFSTHFSLWGILRKEHPEWTDRDDSYFPRGRVLYATDEGLFIIRMDSCIPPGVIPEILSAFNLTNVPHLKIHIVHGRDPDSGDHHYQCHVCGDQTRRRVL
jgi:hypothetical protein